MSIYYGLIIPRSYNDYFHRSNPNEIIDVFTNSGTVWTIANGGTGAGTVAEARANLGIFTDDRLNKESTNPVQNKVIADLIPTQATSTNQLADKDYVNSTVGTNTANYIYKTEIGGEKVPFSSIAELEAYAGTVTNNDYAFVTGLDENGNVYFDRYKADVNGSNVSWAKEYRLNNSSFTAEQWAAIQSGITAADVAKIPDIDSKVPTTRKVNGHALSADITVTKSDVGLGNVNNTSDANKPISTATQTALDGKVPTTRTINNKALSDNITLSASDVNALAANSVVNNLTSTSTTAPLSAAQGKALNDGKQAALVSGTNIKTINNTSLLGSGNIVISAGNLIDDTKTDTAHVWSSTKTNGEITKFVTCNTSATTLAKDIGSTTYTTGTRLAILFTNGHTKVGTKTGNKVTSNYPTIGGHPIKVGGEYAGENFVSAGDVHELIYDGSSFHDITADVIYKGGDSTNGYYEKKRNGKIEQRGTININNADNGTFTYPIKLEIVESVADSTTKGSQTPTQYTNSQTISSLSNSSISYICGGSVITKIYVHIIGH